jgi:hypothetical protein
MSDLIPFAVIAWVLSLVYTFAVTSSLLLGGV